MNNLPFCWLDKLSRMDLSTYPYGEIKDVLIELGKVAFVRKTLHLGKTIYRGRPHRSFAETFKYKRELSYKPQEFNTTYQRASTPNKTMFYGCVVPEKLGPEDLSIGRGTVLSEISSLCRNRAFMGEEKITFSGWKVIEDINLAMIIHHQNYLRQGAEITELNGKLRMFMEGNSPEIVNRTIMISEFMANEFAKSCIRQDYDYLISAVFAERLIELGYDGVFYPSVRMDGKGYNIAITPLAADNKLKLIWAGESTVYKKENCILVDDDTHAEVKNQEAEIEYLPSEFGLGRDVMYQQLENCLEESRTYNRMD